MHAALFALLLTSGFLVIQNPAPPTIQNTPDQNVSSSKPQPMPADAPLPDPKMQGRTEQSKSRLKRILQKLDPNCASLVVFESCWSSPPEPPKSNVAESEREYAHDLDIGQFNYNEKNYKGAALRYAHALTYKPDDPTATYKLALSLEKLKDLEEARAGYENYLDLAPTGKYAKEAAVALKRLPKPEKKNTDPKVQ